MLGVAARAPPARGHRLPARSSTTIPRVEANVHVSWLDPCKVRRVTVVGSTKMVVFDDLATEERIRVHDKGVATSPTRLRRPDPAPDVLPVRRRGRAVPRGQRAAARRGRALRRLRAHRHAARCTDGANGLAVVEVLEAAQLSMRERRAVASTRSRRRVRAARAAQPCRPGGQPARAVGSRDDRRLDRPTRRVPFLDLAAMTEEVARGGAGTSGQRCWTPARSSAARPSSRFEQAVRAPTAAPRTPSAWPTAPTRCT